MPLVSIREYARSKGVSHTAIEKRVKHGKIRLVDGQIDPAKADADWEQNRDELQQQRGARSTGKLKAAAPTTPHAPDKPTSAPRPSPEALRAAHAEVNRAKATGTLPAYQTGREAVRLAREYLKLKHEEDSLVDAEQVRGETESRFRNDAEALLNWPARVVADIAAELGTDEHQTHAVLDRYVRQFMRERSMVGADGAAHA